MKILLFIEDFFKDQIIKFFDFCLLSKEIQIDHRSERELEAFRDGYLGICEQRIFENFNQEEKQVIIMGKHLSNGSALSFKNNTLILSPKEFNQDIPVALQVALYV